MDWRIDDQIISGNLADKVISTLSYKNEKFSDHALLIMGRNVTVKVWMGKWVGWISDSASTFNNSVAAIALSSLQQPFIYRGDAKPS